MPSRFTETDWREIEHRLKVTDEHPVIKRIDGQLTEGRAVMAGLRMDVDRLSVGVAENTRVTEKNTKVTEANTAATQTSNEIMGTVVGGFKALEFFARIVKSLGAIGAFAAFLWYAITHGWHKAMAHFPGIAEWLR